MRETNHCAHAVDDLRRIANLDVGRITNQTVLHLIGKLRSSVKFRAPEYGRIFDIKHGASLWSEIGTYCPAFRLPYPVIALEWDVPDCHSLSDVSMAIGGDGSAYDAVVCLAYEEDLDGCHQVSFWPMYRRVDAEGKIWVPLNFGAVIRPGTQDIRFFPQTDDGYKMGPLHPAIKADIRGELTTFIQFLCALNCSNSEITETPHPKKSLNDKRSKRGKTPFYTYKVLTISASRWNAAKSIGQGGHSSPRVHLRRGHIRRLKDRNIWVNACVVGDKSAGMVDKEYAVKA